MQLLKSWYESFLFIKQPHLGLKFRHTLGATYSIWWHHIWWLLMLLMIIRVGGTLDILGLQLPKLIENVLHYGEIVGWLIVYFVLQASLYAAITDDEREYTWRHYAKLLIIAAIPLIICKSIATLVLPYFNPITYLLIIFLIPFGIGINVATSAFFTFFMLNLFASDHSIKAALLSVAQALKMVVFTYPFLIISHAGAFVIFWVVDFSIRSFISYLFRFGGSRFVPMAMKESLFGFKTGLLAAPWVVFAVPFLLVWLGIFYQSKAKQIVR